MIEYVNSNAKAIYMWRLVDHPAIRVVPAHGFAVFLDNFMLTHFGCTTSKAHHLFSDITSSTALCTGQMTFYYKRSAGTPFRAFWLLASPSGSPLSPAYGWCLMHVGRDASSTSLGWSLLPSSIVIVLALVNSAVSPTGTEVSQRDLGVPPYSLSVLLPQDCCAFQLVLVCIVVEATPKWSMWLPPRGFRIWCMTILGVPGWVPTDDMQPKLWVKACLGCDLSHQVWIVRTSGKGNTLSYQRVFHLDPYVHTQTSVALATIHLGGKDGLG